MYYDFWSVEFILYIRHKDESRAMEVATKAFPQGKWQPLEYRPIKRNDAGRDAVLWQVGNDRLQAEETFRILIDCSNELLQNRVFTLRLNRASDWR